MPFVNAGKKEPTRESAATASPGVVPRPLKPGDQITVEGYPAKDGAKLASAKRVTFADGHTVFGESPSDAKPAY